MIESGSEGRARSNEPIIGIVVKRWPRLSETFVLSEILGLERAGLRLRLYPLMDSHEATSQDAIGEVRAPVSYLRTGTLADVAPLLSAQWALLRWRPGPYLRTLAYVLRRRRHRSTFVHFFEAARLVSRVREHGVTHLHAQFAHGPTSVAHFASLLGGVPFSFTGHAKDIYLSPRDLLAVKVAAAEFVATCTAHNAAYLRELAAPEDRSKIHLVYHGVDTRRFASGASGPPARVSGRQADGASPFAMMAVGRLVEKKGYVTLLRACALLRRSGSPFMLSIYGSGPQKGELADLISALDLGAVVRLKGTRKQADLIALYRDADAFVLSPEVLDSGDRDGIPNVLMEAMAAGLPVVSTIVSGIPELIEHDVSGLLVPPRDEVALAEALRQLMDPASGPALQARLASRARRRVVEHFDAAFHVRRMVDLLRAETASGVEGSQSGLARAPGLDPSRQEERRLEAELA